MASIGIAYDEAVVAAAQPADHVVFRLPEDAPRGFVIPAYNEEQNLPRLFADLEERAALLTPGSRIFIVDDGSTDRTAELVRAYDGPLPLQLVELGQNRGPGAAFLAGFDAALACMPDESLIVTLEADTTSDLDALPEMFRRACLDAELVLASVHGGGEMTNVNPLRRFLSASAGRVVRSTLGVDAHTVSSFFRVYRASTLRGGFAAYGQSLIRERGFACMAEVLSNLSRLGARVVEVPVDLDGSRRIGESHMRVLPTILGYARLLGRSSLARGAA